MEVSISQLKQQFESIGLSDKDSLSLARMLIEREADKMVSFDENRSATQADVVVALNSFIGEYELYNDANKVKKYTEMLMK